MDQMHNHNHLHKMARRDYTTIDGTVYSVENVTPSPTFTGVIGGYSTASVSVPQTQSSASAATDSPTDGSPSSTSTSSSVTATNTPAPSYTAGAITPESLPSSSSSTMSTGGRIGLAVVIILIIGGLAGAAVFYMSRKKKQVLVQQERQDAEKDAVAAEARRRTFLASQKEEAPKLSLRPASSFLPDLLNGVKRKSRISQGNMLASTTERNPWKEQYLAAIGKGQDIPMSEKSPTIENPFTDPENPFADPVKRKVSASGSDSSSSSKSSTAASSPSVSDTVSHTEPTTTVANDDTDSNHASVPISDEEIQSVLTRPRRLQEPVEMPSSPVVPAPLQPPKAVSTPPPSNNDNNVYRILMDFTPSMEDELELKAGQVVRMLHEYDDGWCLASRLDRSLQGVVPRTCLAPKPSKPRSQPGNRPTSPSMRNGPPVSRPMSPANGPRVAGSQSTRNSLVNNQPLSPGAYNQTPRPLSPGPRPQPKRSMSPGPIAPPQLGANRGRRSNSASARAREVQDRRASPPGPSKLGPGVPGMAM